MIFSEAICADCRKFSISSCKFVEGQDITNLKPWQSILFMLYLPLDNKRCPLSTMSSKNVKAISIMVYWPKLFDQLEISQSDDKTFYIWISEACKVVGKILFFFLNRVLTLINIVPIRTELVFGDSIFLKLRILIPFCERFKSSTLII